MGAAAVKPVHIAVGSSNAEYSRDDRPHSYASGELSSEDDSLELLPRATSSQQMPHRTASTLPVLSPSWSPPCSPGSTTCRGGGGPAMRRSYPRPPAPLALGLQHLPDVTCSCNNPLFAESDEVQM